MSRQRWEVVGGADKGGILVRSGQSTSSEEMPSRLSTGAIVEELQLAGERLRYQRVTGEGPESGWVSIALKDKPLLVRSAVATDGGAATLPPAAAVSPAVFAGAGGPPASAPADPGGPAAPASPGESWAVKEGDYYVTLGVLFKKPGTDPESEKILRLSRKVGAVVHTTGKIWKSPKGGFWAELDTSAGDSGAGEKPGYAMIDANGFGTPGPCLQKADPADGPPLVLRAAAPAGGKPWDGGADAEKEFVALAKTTLAEVKAVIAMLFGLNKAGLTVNAPPDYKGAALTDASTVRDAGFTNGALVHFEVAGPKAMKLKVMSPLEEGVKLVDLEVKEDWSVGQVKTLLCATTGLKKASMIMAKGKMGQRVSEDAQLKEEQLLLDCGYRDGDEIAFIYMGDPAADLEGFLSKAR